MALINCPNCGGRLSDQAEQCPHCGCAVGAKNGTLKADNGKILRIIASVVCWLSAAVILVAFLIGERVGDIFCGYLPCDRFDWFRCEYEQLYAPFVLCALLLIIGVIVYPFNLKKKLLCLLISIIGLFVVFGGIYLLSDPYDYKSDPYSEWYRDNVINDWENFGDNINNTAWIDSDGDFVIVFSDGVAYLSGKSRHGGRLVEQGEYKIDGIQAIFDNISIDKRSFSGYFTVRHMILKNWQYRLESHDFTRIPLSDLPNYGFSQEIIDRISTSEEAKSGKSGAQSEVSEQPIQEQTTKDAAEDFLTSCISSEDIVSIKSGDYVRYSDFNCSLDNFFSYFNNLLQNKGYTLTDSKVEYGDFTEMEGEEKITQYIYKKESPNDSSLWNKVVITDGAYHNIEIEFSDIAGADGFLDKCKEMGFKKSQYGTCLVFNETDGTEMSIDRKGNKITINEGGL